MVRLFMNADLVERRCIARRMAEGLAWRKHASRVALLLIAAVGIVPLAAMAQASPLLDSRVTQHSVGETICRPGYADAVALPLEQAMALKRRLLAQRGIDPGDGHRYALDQRIPVVLGGSPAAEANLDLLPWDGHGGERRKALVAVQLKRCVCTGQISLATAQAAISGDWVREYDHLSRMVCGVTTSSGLTAVQDAAP